jgi:uncharacterized membrane protein YfcA
MADTNLDALRKEAQQKAQAVKQIEARTEVAADAKPLWTPQIGLCLSFSILTFGVLVLALMSLMMGKTRVNVNALIRAFALILIIVAAVFLIVAGYTEQQIAPAIGLLGTIAGYLLGAGRSNVVTEEERANGAGQAVKP